MKSIIKAKDVFSHREDCSTGSSANLGYAGCQQSDAVGEKNL